MKFLSLLFLNMFFIASFAQMNQENLYTLSLEETIALACDSTLNAMIIQNNFFIEHFMYLNHKAGKLPSLDLNSTPLNFNRSITEEYSFSDSTYHYVDQQTINSHVSLSLNQVISKTGGRFYVNSDLNRLQNIGKNTPTQYSSNIIKIGISQQLFGFNSYKWDDKIIALKYEKAKMEYIESAQSLSLEAISYFFNLLKAQKELEISKINFKNADTLFFIGQNRYDLGLLSLEDLYLLEISFLQSQNNVKISQQNLEKAKNALNSFLRLNGNRNIQLSIPNKVDSIQINAEKALRLANENNPLTYRNKQMLLEAQKEKERAKNDKGFSSSLNASFGLNKRSTTLSGSYQSPVDQESVNISLRIPIMDWGAAKSAYLISVFQEENANYSAQKSESDFQQKVLSTVFNFNTLYDNVENAHKIQNLALKLYNLSIDGFIIGKTNITQLFDAQNYSIVAQREYINSLESYWSTIYKVQQYTLYDFLHDISLTKEFDAYFVIE